MQIKQTRYNCDWDCSRQNKRYSEKEKEFIQQSWKNGKSIVEIAKKLKRGYWAIEVQIMYNLNINKNKNYNDHTDNENHNHNHNKFKSVTSAIKKRKTRPNDFKQKVQPPPKKKKRFNHSNQMFGNSIKRSAQLRRKFYNQTTNCVKTETTEIENHINKLMGL